MMMRTVQFALLLALCLALAGAAQATPLSLSLTDSPDIFSGLIDVTYDAASDLLVADGLALEFDDGTGVPLTIDSGDFHLEATIPASGMASAGSLSVLGSVDGVGPSLLTGELSDFGFVDAGGDPFEFLFEITGGALADAFGGVGSVLGVILSDTGFQGHFADNFDNLIAQIPGTGFGVADVAPLAVPEPAGLLLFAVGLGWVQLTLRRRV